MGKCFALRGYLAVFVRWAARLATVPPAKGGEVLDMRKLFFFVLLLLVCVVGLGYYLGWLTFATSNDPDSGRTVVQLSFGRAK